MEFSGTLLVEMDVNLEGKTENIHLIRGIGHGLDEQALLAAASYRFDPATVNGKPVVTRMHLELTFRF